MFDMQSCQVILPKVDANYCCQSFKKMYIISLLNATKYISVWYSSIFVPVRFDWWIY